MGPLAEKGPRNLSAASVVEATRNTSLWRQPWVLVTAFFHRDTQHLSIAE